MTQIESALLQPHHTLTKILDLRRRMTRKELTVCFQKEHAQQVLGLCPKKGRGRDITHIDTSEIAEVLGVESLTIALDESDGTVEFTLQAA